MNGPGDDPIGEALDRAAAHASFLRGLIRRRPEIVDALRSHGPAEAIAVGRAEAEGQPAARALRRERQALALSVAIGDLAGLLPLEAVTDALSAFADRVLDTAIRTAIAERTPDASPVGFAALALGKHGSRELNYSSDIDPILLFDPDTLPRRAREEPEEAAVRIARRVVELLQHIDADGQVLRVDLRLRPAPEASPLAVSVGAALVHYEASALTWERAAFIRARAAAGDVALGRRFLDQVQPFVWRRSLDYGAIQEVRALSRRIRDHYAQGQRIGPGYDLKRGRGGIREVEFFAQIHQLIHGGRDPSLRVPATLDALAALAAADRIDAVTATALADAYRLLRTVEHRLQMVDDRQTHRLPPDVAALDAVAGLHGLAAYDALVDDQAAAALPFAAEPLDAALRSAGFSDVATVAGRIAGWRSRTVPALRSAAAQEALERVLPALIEALAAAPDGAAAVNRFDDLVRGLPSALNLFRLLDAQRPLLLRLAAILVHAPALATQLGRRADLLDGLIDRSSLAPPPPVAEIAATLLREERADDPQGMLDGARRGVGEWRFALGVQLIERLHDPLAVGEGYARVAEGAVEALAAATVRAFEAAHGRVPGGELVVLALGRLGGGMLTDASDLDLVFLFTGDFAAESDGARRLGATHYFNRLGQRVVAALSVPTAAGPLYAVDTRLRPSGMQGLLAVSLDSFARYQAESAWTWEHMALTRARPVFGSAAARTAVADIVAETLRRARDPVALTADVARMRAEVARHKPPAGPMDVKLIEGGLVDAEFAVHLLQLRHRTALDPRLGQATEALAAQGLLAPGFAAAHALLTRLLVTLRLVSPGGGEPAEVSRALVADACGQADWAVLMAAYDAARSLVAGEWRRVAGLDRQAQGEPTC